MSVPLEELPAEVRRACTRLRDELVELLRDELVALWVYGAATFRDRPKRLGDVDTHGVLVSVPGRATADAIDRLQASIAEDCGIEWDSWFILASAARGAQPPPHAFRVNLPDWAWALHRAHWLAEQYVALHGVAPSELVPPPTWADLLEALDDELDFIERLIEEDKDDPAHAAFGIWNACRIIYSMETREVVVSKRAAANWGLENLPTSWHPGLHAARRLYDDEAIDGDEFLLRSALPAIVGAARDRLTPRSV